MELKNIFVTVIFKLRCGSELRGLSVGAVSMWTYYPSMHVPGRSVTSCLPAMHDSNFWSLVRYTSLVQAYLFHVVSVQPLRIEFLI